MGGGRCGGGGGGGSIIHYVADPRHFSPLMTTYIGREGDDYTLHCWRETVQSFNDNIDTGGGRWGEGDDYTLHCWPETVQSSNDNIDTGGVEGVLGGGGGRLHTALLTRDSSVLSTTIV